jgi:hypothetical protein
MFGCLCLNQSPKVGDFTMIKNKKTGGLLTFLFFTNEYFIYKLFVSAITLL